jgi:putative ABC transport system substrate-binding protein
MPSIEEGAKLMAVQVEKMPYNDAVDIVRSIDAFAALPNGSLLLLPPSPSAINREIIMRLVLQHRLPTVAVDRAYAAEGILMTYGTSNIDLGRRAAGYVDRILRGASPRDLPVEFATKFELVINLKTAKAIDLVISEALLLRADEVIQ